MMTRPATIAELREQIIGLAVLWASDYEPYDRIDIQLDSAVHDFLGQIEEASGFQPVLPDRYVPTCWNQIVAAAWQWALSRSAEEDVMRTQALRECARAYQEQIAARPELRYRLVVCGRPVTGFVSDDRAIVQRVARQLADRLGRTVRVAFAGIALLDVSPSVKPHVGSRR